MTDENKQWGQISFVVTADQQDAVEDVLWQQGAVSITEESGDGSEIFQVFSAQQSVWQQVKLTALFESDTNLDEVNKVLLTSLNDISISQEVIHDEDWHKRWLSQFTPIKINDDFWVCPSWISPPNPNASNIMIDPGMAFGTGTHETTKGCLMAMHGINFNAKTVIDYGCGSGILSIGAIKLGAVDVKAIDIDAKALTVTKENCEKNDIGNEVSVYLPEEFEQQAKAGKWQADVVIANILSETLIELAEDISAKIKPGGVLLLSGILETQAENIKSVYNQVNNTKQLQWQQTIENRWVTLMAQVD